MEYSESCSRLIKLFKSKHYTYHEEEVLALQEFCNSLEAGDTPAMALASAKNLEFSVGWEDA